MYPCCTVALSTIWNSCLWGRREIRCSGCRCSFGWWSLYQFGGWRRSTPQICRIHGIIMCTSLYKLYKLELRIQTYPEAQFPATAPERSWHSEEVRQVPFRLAPFLNNKKMKKVLKIKANCNFDFSPHVFWVDVQGAFLKVTMLNMEKTEKGKKIEILTSVEQCINFVRFPPLSVSSVAFILVTGADASAASSATLPLPLPLLPPGEASAAILA